MAKNTKQPNLSLSDYFAYYYTSINNNKFFAGIVMLIMNIGAKYATIEFSKTQEQALRNGLAREMLIFAVAFSATQDIVISLLLTGAFFILAEYLFNDESSLCIIPERMRRIALEIDMNHDNKITPDEERRAIEVLQKAEMQKKHYNQAKFTGHLLNNQ